MCQFLFNNKHRHEVEQSKHIKISTIFLLVLSIFQAKNLKSSSFGNGDCVTKLVYAISKLRYKDGSGDPIAFKNFLKSMGLKPSLIPRYESALITYGSMFIYTNKTTCIL